MAASFLVRRYDDELMLIDDIVTMLNELGDEKRRRVAAYVAARFL